MSFGFLGIQFGFALQGGNMSRIFQTLGANKDDIPIKGDVVNLTVDRGTIQSPAVDNGDGTYTATYTAGNVADTAKITALTNSGQ